MGILGEKREMPSIQFEPCRQALLDVKSALNPKQWEPSLRKGLKKPSSNEKQMAPGHFSCWSAGVTYRNLTKHNLFPTTNTPAHEEFLSHLQPDAAINTQQEGGRTHCIPPAWDRWSQTTLQGHNKTSLLTATRAIGWGLRSSSRSWPSMLYSKKLPGGSAFIYGQPNLFSYIPSSLIKFKFLDYEDLLFFWAWLRCREHSHSSTLLESTTIAYDSNKHCGGGSCSRGSSQPMS